MAAQYTEVNFDGLVGPTHNYAGLAYGNLASELNQSTYSNPKLAALQGLEKMKSLHDLGFIQGVFPPQERPAITTLRQLGFTGKDENILQKAAQQAPELLSACCSASSMWTANAATVSPSCDTKDGKIHFTPANLISHFHRSIEIDTTTKILTTIFKDSAYFQHHAPLPTSHLFSDEGAANHMQFIPDHGESGVELFVYGATENRTGSTQRFPARQGYEASKAIARLHQLDEAKVIFAQQNPDVIDLGVFHNDVIAVSHQCMLFCHEQAYVNQQQLITQLGQMLGGKLNLIQVCASDISVQRAVQSYLFNSQILEKPSGQVLLVVPAECEQDTVVWQYLNSLIKSKVGIDELKVVDLRQSMKNGGGPACLRLRVIMSEAEQKACHQQSFLSDALYHHLFQWIDTHYRDQLLVEDLADPQLLLESRTALDELTQILELGSIYPFQQGH